MGQRTNNPIDIKQWKEVIEHSSYIQTLYEANLSCNGCGNPIKKGEKITRLVTSQGQEYYHYDKCLKGVEIIQ